MPRAFKPSRYNVLFEDDGRHYAFNLWTHALMEIDPDLQELLSRNGEELRPNDLAAASVPADFTAGFLVESELDEVDYLRNSHLSAKYDRSVSTLVVYPTLDCNFKCPYCFERFKGETMDRRIVQRLKRYIANQAGTLRALNLRWSGGEPLLALDIIEDLSEAVLARSRAGDLLFRSSMATNGYLLTEDVVLRLKDLCVESLQITLDGPPAMHDRRRSLLNGEGTFDVVLSNLCLAAEHLDVVLRVNVDLKNVEQFTELLTIVAARKPNLRNIRLSCMPVVSCRDTSACLLDNAFCEVESDLIRIADRFGFAYSVHPNAGRLMRCPLYHCNSWVIDPRGRGYRCPYGIGDPDQAIGTLDEDGRMRLSDLPGYVETLSLTPFDLQECRDCEILPLCFGKCALLWKRREAGVGEGCIPDRRSILDKLRYMVASGNQMCQFRRMSR